MNIRKVVPGQYRVIGKRAVYYVTKTATGWTTTATVGNVFDTVPTFGTAPTKRWAMAAIESYESN